VLRGGLVLAGAAVAVASWVLAARREVPDGEERIFFAVNGLPRPVGVALWPVMQLGSLVGGVLAGAAIGVLDGSVVTGLVLSGTALVAWLGAKAVKGRVRRGRPADFFEHAVLREQATDFGYVSGHTMVAVSLAVASGPVVPAWGELALLVAALLVGVGRLYVGAHLPLDVVGGAGLGVGAGALGAIALDALT
jgi:undecaprenyl-diphosphatase